MVLVRHQHRQPVMKSTNLEPGDARLGARDDVQNADRTNARDGVVGNRGVRHEDVGVARWKDIVLVH